MASPDFNTTATRCVQAFGSTAHDAIDACRAGGARLGRFASSRWDQAFEQARPQLSAETQRNAARTRRAVARVWRRGLAASTAGADIAVDTLVEAAQQALDRAQARGGRG